MKYDAIPELSREEIEAAVNRNRPEELSVAVLAASLHAEDPAWAEDVCVSLAAHSDPRVRGNAVLGLGHIARLHRVLTPRSRKIVEASLADPSELVRGQADAARDDLHQFLRNPDETGGV
jgi:hypothetical protein